MEQELSTEQISEILNIALDLGFRGFGGYCSSAAIAINKVLFNYQGVLTIIVNDYLWTKYNRFVGHVVVKFKDYYWDADARPKLIEDIDDWGDVHSDSTYIDVFRSYGARWTEKRASESAIFELDSMDELPWGHEDSLLQEAYLREALRIFNLK